MQVLADIRPADALPRLMVVGDSLSSAYGFEPDRGWVRLLAERVSGRFQVVNASISGDTTRGALARLDPALATHAPGVVILEIGGNDGLRGLPLAEIERNLDALVRRCQDAGAAVLLLEIQLPPNLGPVYNQRFRALYGKVAERHGAKVAAFPLDQIALDAELIQRDGIHPTAKAQPLIVDSIWPDLASLIDAEAKDGVVAPL